MSCSRGGGALVALTACGGTRTSLPTSSEWAIVGATSSTLKLPDLTVDSVSINTEAIDGAGKGIFIIWLGASNGDYEALRNQCYNNLPANKYYSGVSSQSATDLEEKYDTHTAFWGYYTKGNIKYAASINYYSEHFQDEYVEYAAKTLVLFIFEFETDNSGNGGETDSWPANAISSAIGTSIPEYTGTRTSITFDSLAANTATITVNGTNQADVNAYKSALVSNGFTETVANGYSKVSSNQTIVVTLTFAVNMLIISAVAVTI